jgi:hypothetical protein
MPGPGIRHDNILLVCSVDHFLIAHGPTGLDNAIRARSNHDIEPITEGEEGIRRDHRTG